jgi:hypothetical protein
MVCLGDLLTLWHHAQWAGGSLQLLHRSVFPTHLQGLPNSHLPLLYLLCSATFVCVDALASSSEAIAAAAAKVGPHQLHWGSSSLSCTQVAPVHLSGLLPPAAAACSK